MSQSQPSVTPAPPIASEAKVPKEWAEELWREFTAAGRAHFETLFESNTPPTSTTDSFPVPTESECWQAFDEVAAKHMADTAETLKGQLDNTLLFAALFSAINTTFLAYTLPAISTGSQDTTNSLLLYVIQGVNNQSSDAASQLLASATASGRTTNIAINQLFSISLMLSIIATLTTVVGQTWVTSYSRTTRADADMVPRQRERKMLGAERWYFQAILEILLPSMMQFALVVFCIGFAMLLWSINVAVAVAVLPFLALGFGSVAAFTVCAVWDPNCPFQTPLSSTIIPRTLSFIYWMWLFIPTLFHFVAYCAGRALRHMRSGEPFYYDESGRGLISLLLELIKENGIHGDRFREKRHGVAASMRRPRDVDSVRHAELVPRILDHSSDPASVGKAISTLLHGDIRHIARDLYRSSAFGTLIAWIGNLITVRVPNPQQPAWVAALRVVWHTFAAIPVVGEPDKLDRQLYDTLLSLEYALFGRDRSDWNGNMSNLEGILEFAVCAKLLAMMPLYKTDDNLSGYWPFLDLLPRMDLIIGHLNSYQEPCGFRQLRYVQQLVGTLSTWDQAQDMRIADEPTPLDVKLRSTTAANAIFGIYDRACTDARPVWEQSLPLPELTAKDVIHLSFMAKTLVTVSGPDDLFGPYARLWTYTIFQKLASPSFGQLNWYFIEKHVEEVALALKVLLKDDRVSLTLSSADEHALKILPFSNVVPKKSEALGTCIYFLKTPIDAGTSTAITENDGYPAEVFVAIGLHLFRVLNLSVEPNRTAVVVIDFLRYLKTNFSSLEWSRDSLSRAFRICRTATKFAEDNQTEDRKSGSEYSEELVLLSNSITGLGLEALAIHGETIARLAYLGHTDASSVVTHITTFIRDLKPGEVTEKQWDALNCFEKVISSQRSDKPDWNAVQSAFLAVVKRNVFYPLNDNLTHR